MKATARPDSLVHTASFGSPSWSKFKPVKVVKHCSQVVESVGYVQHVESHNAPPFFESFLGSVAIETSLGPPLGVKSELMIIRGPTVDPSNKPGLAWNTDVKPLDTTLAYVY